ncbi:MAG TPA: Ig-like domain-containing protein [Acidimicrobiales bacterium]|nr:Ig-like domain-containing protein [Acidimicrobiales bacterium]
MSTRVRAVLVLAFGMLVALAGLGSPATAAEGTVQASAAQRGYVLVDNAGVTTGFGDAAAAGSLSGAKLRAPIVDAESTPTGLGHVMAASDGGVFTFGDAPFFGSLAGTKLNAPIVGVDVTRTGGGYILFAADGGVFTFGDAPYRGSLGSMKLNKPIVDGALNKANDGYILTAGDGGVFTFGNTSFGGSMAGTKLNGPVVEIMMADEGPGYALIADDGGIFTFNGFTFYGSLGGMKLNAPITDAAPSSTGDGYNLLGADGGVFAFGDAPFAGSLGGTKVPRPLIAILGLANEAPVANADTYSATEDTVLTKSAAEGVLANDTDDDGDPLTASLVTGPTKGTLTLNGDGSFTYTPNANANGTDSFTYRATDSNDASDTATATINVGGVNDAPVAVGDTGATSEDTALVVAAPGVLANDADIDLDPLTAVLVAGPSNGSLTLNPNGSYTYTPNANYNGADSFTYKANDGAADSNTVTVALTVTAVNDAPVAVNDVGSTDEDTVLNVPAPGVLANDSDVEGSPMTAGLVDDVDNGTLTLNPNGSYTYTPNANYNGADSFTYKANDGTAEGNTATVTLTVTAVNDAPVADDDSYSTNEDTPLTGNAPGVLDGDSDVDGDSLSSTVLDDVDHGTLVLNADGSFTYTPTANYNGPDAFTYTVADGNGGTDVGAVTLTVNAVNDAPVAVNDAYNTAEDTPLAVVAPGVLANDSDVEGSPLTAVLGTGPANGTLALNADGSFTYTPNADYAGGDSFTYKANDGTSDSNVATVNLTVNPVNDAPVADDDTYNVAEDTPLVVAAPGVLLGDSDADRDTLTATVLDDVDHGTLALNADGSFTYTPTAGYNGPDAFTYTVADGNGGSDTGAVALTVDSVNDAPVAADDAYNTNEDTPLVVTAPGVLGNDTDADGSPLTATTFGNAVNGAVTGNPDGSFTFTPVANFTGIASFDYTVSDGTLTDSGTVTVTVAPVADAPVATNDSYATDEDVTRNVVAPGVLANDTDADGDALTAVLVNGPANGTLTLNADGSFSYTPNPNFNGADTFTYKANDGGLDSNIATVTITVNPIADAPVAVDDGPYAGVQNTNLTVAAPGVLANDTDADGQALTAGNASDPANGTVTLNPDGSFTYAPGTFFTGTDTFTYDVSDGTATDSGTVTINVMPPNATPTADATSASGNEDGGAIPVTLTGHDADGDALTFTAGTASNGLVTVPSGTSCDTNTPSTCTATVTYTPSANFNGGDSFTYTVNDGTIDSAPATATITVNPVNDEPTFTKGDNQSVNEDAGAQTVNGWATAVSAGPANESVQAVTFTVTTDNDGMFSALPVVNSAGDLTYTAAANANGSATVSVTPVDDGGTANGGDDTGATQTFTITVTAVNDTPSFTKGSDQTVNEDAGAQSISNWASAISKGPGDESAQTLSFTTSNDNNALFSVQPGVTPTGTLTYTTAPNIYGSATVTISLSDNGGTANGGDDTSDAQTFTITVNPVNDAPVAAAKSFDVETNMKRSISGLLAGATDPNDVAGDAAWSPTYTLGSVTAGAGCVGCTISNVDNANGSFDFEPPAGGTGDYTVTYTVVDSGHPAPGVASAPQTITFTVSGPVIWYADAASGNDTTGTGTLTRPFATLTKVATVDAAGHRVFVHSGTYAAGISLPNNEWLVGAGAKATSFDDLMGITPPAGTVARPAVNGTNPTVQSTVTLGTDNVVRGLTLTGANALTGTSFGTLTTGVGSAADVVLNSAGQALSLSTGTITGDFVSTTSSGGTDNVYLSAVNTTTPTSLGTGALSGAAAEGFQVVSGTGTFTYAGTVANATGTTVSIANKTGGTVTFNGAVSDTTGAGVSLTTNTGATIAFNGGVNLTSATSPAFAATGGGTVTVVGATNTLSSTTGTALNVVNTTIGASDLTFQSISANGATNGIVLNSTGSSGNLTVTGTGSTLGSGGTIQNTSGDGISLTNTRDVSLANVNVTNANGHGIRGSAVTNLTLTRAQVAGAGDADNEHGVYLSNQAGTLAITGGTYSDATETLLLVENNNTNVTVNVTGGTTFSSVGGTFASQAIQFTPDGSSAITATVNGTTFTNIKGNSLLVGAANGLGSGTSTVAFTSNTVNSAAGFAGGLVASGQDNTTTVLTVNGNTFTGAGGNGVVSTDTNDNSLLRGTITNNTFTNPAGHAITGFVDETADTRLLIENNSISNAGGDGIQLTNFGDDSPAASVSTAHFIVRNNTISGHSGNGAVAFVGGIGIFNFDGDGDTTCAAVSGNSVSGTPGPAGTYFDIYLQDNGGVGSFKFQESPDTSGTGDVTQAYIHSLNPGTTFGNLFNTDAEFSNGTTCTTP